MPITLLPTHPNTHLSWKWPAKLLDAFAKKGNHESALWLSGYSDRLEIYFLREQEFESLRRRPQTSSFCFCLLIACFFFSLVSRTFVVLLDDVFVCATSFDFVRQSGKPSAGNCPLCNGSWQDNEVIILEKVESFCIVLSILKGQLLRK